MRLAVLGSPISHSLSPVLHKAAYAQLGLPHAFEAIDVNESGAIEIDDLEKELINYH